MKSHPLSPATRRRIAEMFRRLDTRALGPIYCDEGGAAFWADRRGPCERLGVRVAAALRARLPRGGRSLYVGAGVAELPALLMEPAELGREVAAYTLRRREAVLLTRAARGTGVVIRAGNAARARGRYDHLWMVSVLNDPEQVPNASALSYGRADPLTFDPAAFARERRRIRRLTDGVLRRLTLPAWVTTSVEEVPWIREWAGRRGIESVIDPRQYPTALVGDPICFIRLLPRRAYG